MLVGKDGAPPLKAQRRQTLLHLPLALDVHRQLGGGLRRRPLQHPRQLAVLGTYRRPALPYPAVVPPPGQQPLQLPVDAAQKRRKMHAPVGKIAGKIRRRPLAPVQQPGQRVGQGVFCGLVVLLPAQLALGAFGAHRLRRPVENFGGVAVVHRPVVQPLQTVGHRPEGPRRPPQLSGGVGPGAALLLPGALLTGEGGKPPQQLVRQQEEQHAGRRHLVEKAQPRAVRPRPQHRRGVGDDVGQHGKQPPLLGKHPGHQAGKGVGHGVVRRRGGGKIHGKPRSHPGGGADAHAALPARRHHRGGGQHPAHTEHVPHRHPGQRHQQRAPQHQHPHRLPDGEPGVLPLFRPDGEGQPVKIHRPGGHHHLCGEIHRLFAVPPSGGQVNEAHQPVEGGGHQRHEPRPPINIEVAQRHPHGEDHHGRRDVAQPLQKAPEGQVTQRRAQKGGKALQSGPRHPHHGHAEQRVAAEDLRPRQHRRQQEADGALAELHHRRETQLPPARPAAGLLFRSHCVPSFAAAAPGGLSRAALSAGPV